MSSAFALAVALALQARSSPPTAVRAPHDTPPLARAVAIFGRDMRAVPSANSAMILGLGAGAAVGLHNADGPLAAWAARQGSSSYTVIGSVLGNGWTEVGAAAGVYAIGAASHQGRAAHVGGDLLRAQILNAIFTRAAKSAAGRTRPNGGTDSFPSGHTSAAMASATVLEANFGWKVGAPALAAAGFVGWSRVRDRAHWLSDVVIGGTVGAISGLAVGSTHPHRRWTVVAAPTDRGAAVFVVR